jgi:putative endonuclease
VAAHQLQQAGMRLIARNYRCPRGELDLVMMDGSLIVFVEVRYRRSNDYGSAAESVHTGKQQRLIFAAQHYLQMHPGLAAGNCRFDVAVITGSEEHPSCEWIRDAFQA